MTKLATATIELSFQPLNLRTAYPFGISYGSSADTHNVLVKLSFGGYVGLGEAAPASYHNETQSTVMAALQEFQSSEILGGDPFAIAEVTKRMDRKLAGNQAAKAGIEIAMHDLCGKIVGKPVSALLGLSGLKAPITDFTIGIDSLSVVEKKVKEAVAAGYKILKVKQGTDYDKEIINLVRKVTADLPLRVDANGGWTPKQAVHMSKFLAENGVQFIEQPLPKFAPVEDFRYVRENSAIPIFADESICQARDVVRFNGAVDGVVVKLAKTGGLLEALRVISAARACNMQVMFGCMIESSIGVTAAVHLAGLVDHLDLDGALLLGNDPYVGAEYKDGYLVLPEGPGLGVELRS